MTKCYRFEVNYSLIVQSDWRGVPYHVVNTHELALGYGVSDVRCGHVDLAEDHRQWLEPGEDVHKALAHFVLDTGFLHTLSCYINFRHAGDLE
jgi:hypothetical protein